MFENLMPDVDTGSVVSKLNAESTFGFHNLFYQLLTIK